MKYIDKLDCSIKINLLSTRLRRHLTYLLALCCLSLPASAVSLPSEKLHFDIRSASLNFTKVAGHKGLDLSNMAVISDDNGYLWVGTQDGLMRLDGYQSKRYTASARKKNALVSNFINSLAYNRQTKEIWIATTGGLSVFNLKKETFKSYLYDPRVANGIPHNMVQTVLVDSRQRVWIGTKNGLSRYIPESDSFDSFWSKEEQSESNSKGIKNNTGLPHSNILAINEDHQGAIWIATQRGLARYIGNGEFQSFLPFTNDDG